MLHFVYRDTLIEDDELVSSNSFCVSSVSDTLATVDKYG